MMARLPESFGHLWQIGLLFVIYGVILAVCGLVADPTTKTVSWNIDLWWGIVMLIFGAVFLVLSRREQKLDD